MSQRGAIFPGASKKRERRQRLHAAPMPRALAHQHLGASAPVEGGAHDGDRGRVLVAAEMAG
eukprot:986573-Pyramimonas_sp.AAC.1